MKPEENIGLEPVGSTRMVLAGQGMRALSGGATAFFMETLGLQDGERINSNVLCPWVCDDWQQQPQELLAYRPMDLVGERPCLPQPEPSDRGLSCAYYYSPSTLSRTCTLEAPVQLSPTAGLGD